MTPFSKKRHFYWLGYSLRWLCGTSIPFVMRVCDYIPLMSPVTRGKKRISNACFTGKFDFFNKLLPLSELTGACSFCRGMGI